MNKKTFIEVWGFWIPKRYLKKFIKDLSSLIKDIINKSYQDGWNDYLDANGLDDVGFEE